MNEVLSRLIVAAKQALERGDMYVGDERDFQDVREYSRLMEIPVGIWDGRVLLKLRVPRRAVTENGVVSIVSHFGGYYYGLGGERYTSTQLAWIQDKVLP